MILTPQQKQLCDGAIGLSQDKLRPYLEKHALTGGPWFYYNQDRHKLRKRKTRTRRYRARTAKLAKQQGRCALCDSDIGPDARCCLDRTDKVVCSSCNQGLTSWRRLRADGIMEVDMVRFDGGVSEPDNSPERCPGYSPDTNSEHYPGCNTK